MNEQFPTGSPLRGDYVPEGYTKLPNGAKCRCPRMWQSPSGEYYCCNGKGSEEEANSADPIRLVSSKSSESEIAAKLKSLAAVKLAELCLIMDQAFKEGLAIQFDGIVMQYGAHVVVNLRVVKVY